MNTERTTSNSYRLKVAALLFVLGTGLIFWSWGSWVYRTSTKHVAAVSTTRSPDVVDGELPRKIAAGLMMWLYVGLVLIFVVLFGSYAMIRIARRQKQRIDRTREPPTQSESVWEQHKVPEWSSGWEQQDE